MRGIHGRRRGAHARGRAIGGALARVPALAVALVCVTASGPDRVPAEPRAVSLAGPDRAQHLVPAAAEPEARYLGAFQVTYYWIACEDARFDGLPRDQALRDASGRVLAHVASGFRRELDREGTGRLRDGRVLNVAHKVSGEWRYADLGRDAWGTGSAGKPLTPFATVAVDPARVPLGTRLFVPAFEGQALPDGRCHGGRFRAEDRGAAIQDDRLDVFIGEVRNLASWEALVPSHAAADVFLVAEPGGLPGRDPCDE
jgi:3D (Asp-Asp-Asp) domain-containing protein